MIDSASLSTNANHKKVSYKTMTKTRNPDFLQGVPRLFCFDWAVRLSDGEFFFSYPTVLHFKIIVTL